MSLLQKIYYFLLDLFFPNQCPGCGKYGELLCYDCADKIEYIKTSTCLKCGKITQNGQFCSRCRVNYHLNSVLVATVFDEGPVREMLHHFKYNGIQNFSVLLGELLAIKLEHVNFDLKNLIVVPVPLFCKKENRRGFNQAELLAREVSLKKNLSGGLALSRVRDTKTQVGLSRSERIKNIEGAFVCADRELVEGKNVLLIDDVVTTGGTLNECARVLKEAGAKKVYA